MGVSFFGLGVVALILLVVTITVVARRTDGARVSPLKLLLGGIIGLAAVCSVGVLIYSVATRTPATERFYRFDVTTPADVYAGDERIGNTSVSVMLRREIPGVIPLASRDSVGLNQEILKAHNAEADPPKSSPGVWCTIVGDLQQGQDFALAHVKVDRDGKVDPILYILVAAAEESFAVPFRFRYPEGGSYRDDMSTMTAISATTSGFWGQTREEHVSIQASVLRTIGDSAWIDQFPLGTPTIPLP